MDQQENAQFQYRRFPALPRKIAEINPEKDIRVRILGHVIDKVNGSLVVDDGSAKTEIIAEEATVEVNSVARFFCRVMPLETGYELRAEIIQDMSSLDLNLYREIHA